LASVGVDVLYVLTSRRSTGLGVDNLFSRVGSTAGDSDALLAEVQHAVKHFLSTIEELSNTYEVNGKESNIGV
jgi:hypothetical protein